MEKEEYKALIETVGEQYELEISDNLSGKMSIRANELEFEHLSFDDIVAELEDCIPENFKNEENWQDFINEIADEIFDNADDNEPEEEFDEDDD